MIRKGFFLFFVFFMSIATTYASSEIFVNEAIGHEMLRFIEETPDRDFCYAAFSQITHSEILKAIVSNYRRITFKIAIDEQHYDNFAEKIDGLKKQKTSSDNDKEKAEKNRYNELIEEIKSNVIQVPTLHHKFFLNRNGVLTGSANATNGAFGASYELSVRIKRDDPTSSDIIDTYHAYYSMQILRCKTKLNLKKHKHLVSFSNNNEMIIQKIDATRPQEPIRMGLFSCTSGQIINALVRAAKRHCDVIIITDRSKMSDETIDRLAQAGARLCLLGHIKDEESLLVSGPIRLPVRYLDTSKYIHSKIIILNDEFLISSGNATNEANQQFNDMICLNKEENLEAYNTCNQYILDLFETIGSIGNDSLDTFLENQQIKDDEKYAQAVLRRIPTMCNICDELKPKTSHQWMCPAPHNNSYFCCDSCADKIIKEGGPCPFCRHEKTLEEIEAEKRVKAKKDKEDAKHAAFLRAQEENKAKREKAASLCTQGTNNVESPKKSTKSNKSTKSTQNASQDHDDDLDTILEKFKKADLLSGGKMSPDQATTSVSSTTTSPMRLKQMPPYILSDLFDAILNNQGNKVEKLLNKYNPDCLIQTKVNRQNVSATGLCLSAKSNNPTIPQIFLKFGADPNNQDSTFGQTALMVAAGDLNENIVKLLLENPNNPANPNLKNNEGETALLFFSKAHKNNTRIAELLLSHGADPNLPNNSGHTALHYCCQNISAINLATAKLLLEHGADPNLPNHLNTTALQIATECQNIGCVIWLLKYGANPNSQMEKGTTPLHTASFNNNLEIAKVLLKHGADPYKKMNDGFTTPMLFSKSTEMKNLLQSYRK